MHLRRSLGWVALLGLCGSTVMAQEPPPDPTDGTDVDFLFSYYDQDGEHSPVTGGIGTEQLRVGSPVVLVTKKSARWVLRSEVGLDAITSASTDNMDLNELEISSASRLDQRAYTTVGVTRILGDQRIGGSVGFSNEYDYQSLRTGFNWSRDFRQQNTTVAAGFRHFQDTVGLYGIDGVQRGTDRRATSDVSFAVSQVLGPQTVGSAELSLIEQRGFLSTPFHEVILAPTAVSSEGQRVAERLPDSRSRRALGFRLNHAFSKQFVQRVYYRWYTDTWGITGNTIELEPHLRLPTTADAWVFPIYRFHTQTASDHFALPRTFDGSEPFITADGELGQFTSHKMGVGWKTTLSAGGWKWVPKMRQIETRVTYYSRSDGLRAVAASVALGWRF